MSNPKDDEFEKLALDIATPHSGSYRRHLKAPELASWTTPPQESFEKIEEWLSAYEIRSTSRNYDILEARMPVGQAQKLLNTTYYAYADVRGRVVHRVQEYYIPPDLAQLIDFVHPTVNFPHHHNREAKVESSQELAATKDTASISEHGVESLQTAGNPNPCHGRYTTPACVHYFYGVDYTPPLNTNVTIVNTLSDGARVKATDLQHYLELFNRPAAKAEAQLAYHRIGPAVKPFYDAGTNEESLDAQQMIGNGFPVKASYTPLNGNAGAYQFGPSPDQRHVPKKLQKYEDHYVDFLHSLAHDDFVPAALTSSEFQYDLEVTPKYARYICKLWSQLGSRGVSVFFCSADSGSGGLRTAQGARVLPLFTAGCPFVTSVGSTIYTDGEEVAVTLATAKDFHHRSSPFVSGGGFSSIFPRPKYQKKLVDPYVQNASLVEKFTNVSMFNAAGRGYPDVAVFGANLPYVSNGTTRYAGGTSASSPTVAALIGILNAYEESKGRPPLGFLNPWFYWNPDMFNDIKGTGSNELCAAKRCRGLGYPVTKGWDAVTGLGSLRFDKLREALDQMASEGALS